MKPELKAQLTRAWNHPLFGHSDDEHPLATEHQLANFEKKFSPMPPDYRWFLQTLGGGGPDDIDSIVRLPESHRKFGAGNWTQESVFVIGWDNGNPIAIETSSGEVLCEDDNFGGIYLEAPSFEAFLLEQVY